MLMLIFWQLKKNGVVFVSIFDMNCTKYKPNETHRAGIKLN
jgi:hypothetical protein